MIRATMGVLDGGGFVDPRDGKTNLILNPLNFAAATWTLASVTILGNQTIIAPDGTTSASHLKSTAANGIVRANILASMVDGTYSFSAYFKKGRTTADVVGLTALYQNGSFNFPGSPYALSVTDGWVLYDFVFTKTTAQAGSYLFALGYNNVFGLNEEVHIWKPVLYNV